MQQSCAVIEIFDDDESKTVVVYLERKLQQVEAKLSTATIALANAQQKATNLTTERDTKAADLKSMSGRHTTEPMLLSSNYAAPGLRRLARVERLRRDWEVASGLRRLDCNAALGLRRRASPKLGQLAVGTPRRSWVVRGWGAALRIMRWDSDAAPKPRRWG